MIEVSNIDEAWYVAVAILPGTWVEDKDKSDRAGYPILVSDEHPNSYICSLSDRLEVNFNDGSTKNIWLRSAKKVCTEAAEAKNFELTDYDYKMLYQCVDTQILKTSESFTQNHRFEDFNSIKYLLDLSIKVHHILNGENKND